MRYHCASRSLHVEHQGEVETRKQSIYAELGERLASSELQVEEPLPFDFTGGFGYALKQELQGNAAHKAPAPDAAGLFVNRFLAFDHAWQALQRAPPRAGQRTIPMPHGWSHVAGPHCHGQRDDRVRERPPRLLPPPVPMPKPSITAVTRRAVCRHCAGAFRCSAIYGDGRHASLGPTPPDLVAYRIPG